MRAGTGTKPRTANCSPVAQPKSRDPTKSSNSQPASQPAGLLEVAQRKQVNTNPGGNLSSLYPPLVLSSLFFSPPSPPCPLTGCEAAWHQVQRLLQPGSSCLVLVVAVRQHTQLVGNQGVGGAQLLSLKGAGEQGRRGRGVGTTCVLFVTCAWRVGVKQFVATRNSLGTSGLGGAQLLSLREQGSREGPEARHICNAGPKCPDTHSVLAFCCSAS